MVLTHLLKNLDEEANLDLGCLLQESIQRSGTLSLGQNPEPLLDGAELVLEVLVQGSGSHFLESRLVLVNVGDPLLGRLVLGVRVGTLTLALLAVKVG